MTRQELIELANRILDASTEDEQDRLCTVLEQAVTHPAPTGLFAEELTIEEIVDLWLAHTPIPLGPSSPAESEEPSDAPDREQ